MFSEGFAARRDVADAWMVGYLRGVRDYYDAVLLNGANRDEVLSMMAKYLTVKDLAAYRNVVFPGINPDGEVNADSVEATLKHFQKTGDVSSRVTIDGLIDTSFTTFAIGCLGRYHG
jgi:NitT/TauT family transport system substrate-binding protein